ncbi:7210_t:CDS:1, partial [Funneliformis geosporum]
ASFINITIPMWVIQADLCYMLYDQIGNKIYKRDSASVTIGLEKLLTPKNVHLLGLKKI